MDKARREMQERVERLKAERDEWREKYRALILPGTPLEGDDGSEGDVLAYLSRFGEVRPEQPGESAYFEVTSGLFRACVRLDGSVWTVFLSTIAHGYRFPADPSVSQTRFKTLPEAMAWAVERWRELVAESDPTPEQLASAHMGSGSGPAGAVGKTRHFMTGDMGQRTEFGTGYHDCKGLDDEA